MRWYVVVDDNCTDPQPDNAVWTVSRNPNKPGWETDSGFDGYGLTKDEAEELANALNEMVRLRAALEKISTWPDHRLPSPRDIARAALEGK